VLAVALVLVVLAILVRARPIRTAAFALAIVFAVVVLWWETLEPRNDRDWQPDVARTPRADLVGDRLTMQNVRNFDYRSETDYTERWETRTFDLARLAGLDLFMSYWGSPSIAHTILSWEFDDGQHLAISIETRKEKGEGYSALRGFFRQYELTYVVADERDLVRLRTDFRHEDVYLYRLKCAPGVARGLFLEYMNKVDALYEKPEWYNAATSNCTTNIRTHAKLYAEDSPWDWRFLVNGHLDEMLYERGRIDTSRPFDETRRRAYVNPLAQTANGAADFSERIRRGLN
jgi:uncharacterized protein DUF4105